MKEFELTLHNPTGLHARPAKVLVNAAKQYAADVRIWHGEKKANAKSMFSVLALGVESGGQIRMEISGADEQEAARQLEALIRSGLGEGEMLAPADGKAAAQTAAPPQPEPAQEQLVDDRRLIRGIPAAPGLAVGPVFRLERTVLEVTGTFTNVSTEAARLHEALRAAREQLVTLRDQMLTRAPGEAAIFDVHLEVLEDPELLEPVHAKIESQMPAALAWKTTTEDRANVLASLADPLLAARAADLHDVGYRVLSLLVGSGEPQTAAWPAHPVVVVANDLSPSDTASLEQGNVLGFCTAGGGPTSHSAIIARALGLPAVVGAGNAVLNLSNGVTVIVDGNAGTLVVNPDERMREQAEEARRSYQARRLAAQQMSADPAVTQDGHRVEVVANIGGVADARKANVSGAEGVGLLRTEFLFLDRSTAPTEDEQFEVYRDVAAALEGKAVIIRTLDIGGDKPLAYIDQPPEANPFLGVRGIRLCLERPELLQQQLRAILRAAKFGRLRIMFPMVADLSEWRAARSMVQQIAAELGAPMVELGIMIEIPAAALIADWFAQEVDFFSIGTNDLTQYTLAMDRTNPSLGAKSDGLHPAVLRLIARTVEAAHAAGKWVGICGELGADPQAVPILVGLGVDELSVSVPAIAIVKAQIRSLTQAEAEQLARRALGCGTAAEVRGLPAAQAEKAR